jgi:NDP-sugar pyrophosphorylase family protein
MDQVGPSGETIVDYSIYDAVRAGFGKIVFVIRKSIEEEFAEVFLKKLKDKLNMDYVFQELEHLPEGFFVPEGRVKPWGTSHAVLAAETSVHEPFAVINADDFYGYGAFRVMAEFLHEQENDAALFSLVGYRLDSTLSEYGSVARGVCEVDDKGMLTGIVERTRIEKTQNGIVFVQESGRPVSLSGQETVSLNFWGFTPAFFKFAKREFEVFLRESRNNLKAELYIPIIVNKLVKLGQARVKVLECSEKWFGVTYREDKPQVIEEINRLIASRQYPRSLWP